MNSTMLKDITSLDKATELYPKFPQFYDALAAKFSELQETLKNANSDQGRLDYYKWLDFDYLKEVNQETKKLAAQYRDYKTAVVIGMGGSGINSLVLKNSLYEFMPKAQCQSSIDLVIQNNLDPSSFLAKLENLDLDSTLFVLISKSGGTDEVRRNITTLLDIWSKQDNDYLKKFAQQLVVITEPSREGKSNFLHNLRAELKEKTGVEVPSLDNDPNIGGRFSMFSPVGMFSAELMGLSSDALLTAAEEQTAKFFQEEPQANSIAKLAAFDIFLNRQGIQNRYSMVYADSLEAVNKFRAQLKGESLNKNGIDSTVHVAGIGTVNHHSDLELLLKTNNGLILEQVFFAQPSADHSNVTELDSFQDLKGQSNHQSLLDNHINPLAAYILENKTPVIQSIIPQQNEAGLAAFCMQDMLVTVVQAGLQDELGSNEKLDLAIRQWEVEKYKKSLKK